MRLLRSENGSKGSIGVSTLPYNGQAAYLRQRRRAKSLDYFFYTNSQSKKPQAIEIEQ